MVKSNLLSKSLTGQVDFYGLCLDVDKYRMSVERIKEAYIENSPEGEVHYLPEWLESHNKVIEDLDDAYTKYSAAATIAVKSGRMMQEKVSFEEKHVTDEARKYVELFVEGNIKTFMDENGTTQINDNIFSVAQKNLWNKISWMRERTLLIESENKISEENKS